MFYYLPFFQVENPNYDEYDERKFLGLQQYFSTFNPIWDTPLPTKHVPVLTLSFYWQYLTQEGRAGYLMETFLMEWVRNGWFQMESHVQPMSE